MPDPSTADNMYEVSDYPGGSGSVIQGGRRRRRTRRTRRGRKTMVRTHMKKSRRSRKSRRR